MRISDWSSDVCSSDLAEQRDAGRGLRPLVHADRVTAHDMPKLVREYALHLVGAVGRLDQPAVDIDVLAASHEGVDAAVAEQMDAHLPRTQDRKSTRLNSSH